MSRSQKKELTRIILCLVAFIILIPLPLTGAARLAAYLIVYAAIGWDVLLSAVQGILHGQVFDENFLMAVATVGAMILGDYKEGIAVLLFYKVGEWFEGYAVGRSRRSITDLMDICPETANLQQPDGSLLEVSPEEVQAGQIIAVKPGERVPLDGEILEGRSSLDTSSLTGESLPRDVGVGDEVISGCINLSGLVLVKVSRPFEESTVSRILELVEDASDRKAQAENFITRFARYYTPAVCFAALALAVIPPLVTASPFGPWVYRALTFLVISCPCALVISIPLSFFGGIGGASRSGVLVKGSNYLEALAKTETVVFDKTGTLTEGRFAVSRIASQGMDEQELLRLAAAAEHYSTHPIAQSIRSAWGKEFDPASLGEATELAGHGVSTIVDGDVILAGNAGLMEQNGITPTEASQSGTIIHLAKNGVYAGYILVEDVVRPDAKQAVSRLHQLGVKQTVMLTGDQDAVGQKVAKEIGIDTAYTQLLPADKVDRLEKVLAQKDPKTTVVYVGDGVNDAPVLARADVGIAMGGLGSDAAIEAADVVIMTDEPSKIADVVQIGRKTLSIVNQNIVFALGVKAIVLILGALGFATMWAAVFADVGVAVIAILNAMRALGKNPKEKPTAPSSPSQLAA